ncbi:MAG: hypothetical protein HYT71_01420 [Candidatus Aenigmarchaeota archaeon]|nr:hypothetical protein [Candidatus Aenigmarchaeota archaeon]
MPEREINLAQFVMIGIILLAVILGIVFVFIVPNINKTKESGMLDFACTAYQGDIGCNNKACGADYTDEGCEKLLRGVSMDIKNEKIILWTQCDGAGITEAKSCHLRCCGMAIAGRGDPCNDETVKCASGLKCDLSTRSCIAA